MGEDSCGESMSVLLFGRGVITTLYGWLLRRPVTVSRSTCAREGRLNTAFMYIWISQMAAVERKKKHVDEDWALHMVEELPADHS